MWTSIHLSAFAHVLYMCSHHLMHSYEIWQDDSWWKWGNLGVWNFEPQLWVRAEGRQIFHISYV